MTKPLEWAGSCRGQIIEYGLAKMDSGATAVNITARVDEYWDTEEKAWKDCRTNESDKAIELEAEGAIWIIKKDGKINQSQAESLMQHADWDGKPTSIQNGSWKPTPCSFVVNKDTYKDESRFRISWLNDYNREPGASGNVSPEQAQELESQYGSQLRALAGNVARNDVPPPEGKPPAPTSAAPPGITPAEATAGAEGDDVPF